MKKKTRQNQMKKNIAAYVVLAAVTVQFAVWPVSQAQAKVCGPDGILYAKKTAVGVELFYQDPNGYIAHLNEGNPIPLNAFVGERQQIGENRNMGDPSQPSSSQQSSSPISSIVMDVVGLAATIAIAYYGGGILARVGGKAVGGLGSFASKAGGRVFSGVSRVASTIGNGFKSAWRYIRGKPDPKASLSSGTAAISAANAGPAAAKSADAGSVASQNLGNYWTGAEIRGGTSMTKAQPSAASVNANPASSAQSAANAPASSPGAEAASTGEAKTWRGRIGEFLAQAAAFVGADGIVAAARVRADQFVASPRVNRAAGVAAGVGAAYGYNALMKTSTGREEDIETLVDVLAMEKCMQVDSVEQVIEDVMRFLAPAPGITGSHPVVNETAYKQGGGANNSYMTYAPSQSNQRSSGSMYVR